MSTSARARRGRQLWEDNRCPGAGIGEPCVEGYCCWTGIFMLAEDEECVEVLALHECTSQVPAAVTLSKRKSWDSHGDQIQGLDGRMEVERKTLHLRTARASPLPFKGNGIYPLVQIRTLKKSEYGTLTTLSPAYPQNIFHLIPALQRLQIYKCLPSLSRELRFICQSVTSNGRI
jgi:hypothetical protein